MSRRRKANPTKFTENAKKQNREIEKSQEENEESMLTQPPTILIHEHVSLSSLSVGSVYLSRFSCPWA